MFTTEGKPAFVDSARICERLLDSEEHAGEAAIPEVAEDAVEVIQRLQAALLATQAALSQAMQHSENLATCNVQPNEEWHICTDCGDEVDEIIGCLDGSEVCRTCFNAGAY